MSLTEMQRLHGFSPDWQVTYSCAQGLASCSPPFLRVSYLVWGKPVSRNYFILGLAEITVAGLRNVWSRANTQVLAFQLASSSPDIIAKFGRSCSKGTAKPCGKGSARVLS